ncbi:MAG: hypothetical protein M0027_11945 [Candidatus Dormibacteraeota bacterium]|nr:hypothetical protein [Candidatus Dormibacteraeota bacterium]
MPEFRRPSGYLVMGGLKVLSSGVDTLHFSVRGELQEGLLVFLDALKKEAQSSKELQVVTWGEQSLSVALRPHGWRSYPFWASSPNIEVAIGAPSPFPPVFIQTHSAYLHSRGADQAVAEISRWLAANVMRDEPQLAASRVDLYSDLQGWSPLIEDFDRFHCGGVRRRAYSMPAQDQAHLRGRRLSGFVFGGGDLLARCYDKTLELRVRGSEWPKAIWKDWDRDQPVWRVEFQFRRRSLVSLGCPTPAEALAARQQLWRYATQWLSLRVPTPDSNRARWPEASEWAVIREAEIGSPTSPLVRDVVRSADELRIIRGLVGYASSLAAMGSAHGVGAAVRRTVPGFSDYLDRPGETFTDIVHRKKRRRVDVVGSRRLGTTDRGSDGCVRSRSFTPGLLGAGAPLHPGGDQSIRP